MTGIGKKLRLLRGDMNQAELSRRSGIDNAIISKIESGKISGSVSCHQKLAAVFGLRLSEFYAYLEADEVSPIDFHSGNGKTDTYEEFLEILTTIPLAKKMLPTLFSLRPNEERYLEETLKEAERFIMILQGIVEIEVEGNRYVLRKDRRHDKGDSLYSKSHKRHRIKNIGASPARLLCVSAPPVL